jgi:hypothetical protein
MVVGMKQQERAVVVDTEEQSGKKKRKRSSVSEAQEECWLRGMCVLTESKGSDGDSHIESGVQELLWLLLKVWTFCLEGRSGRGES